MELNQTYIVQFDARGEYSRQVQINIGQPVYPYGSYFGGERTVEISCEWNTFVIEFTNILETSNTARFEIAAGLYQGDLFFDNIIIQKLENIKQ